MLDQVEWLQPYTDDAIKELGAKGVTDLVVVPISFVSEHIETLQEIDIEYREIAEDSGIHNFYRVPAPNIHPLFIQALAELVIDALQKPSIKLSEATQIKKNMRMYPQERWQWGMTISAEIWNGRLAMLGFIALIIELITGRGLLHVIGIL